MYDQKYYQRHTTHYAKQNLEAISSFAWIKKQLNVKKGDKILDAGCGTGYLLNFMVKDGQGYGVDISHQAIAQAKKSFPKFDFSVGSIEKLPFVDNFFDKIYCFNVVEHLKDQDKALWQLRRVLKPKGTIIFGTNIRNSLSWQLFKLFLGGDSTHTREFTADEFKIFIGKYFKVVKIIRSSCIGRFPAPINKILNRLFKGDVLIIGRKLT